MSWRAPPACSRSCQTRSSWVVRRPPSTQGIACRSITITSSPTSMIGSRRSLTTSNRSATGQRPAPSPASSCSARSAVSNPASANSAADGHSRSRRLTSTVPRCVCPRSKRRCASRHGWHVTRNQTRDYLDIAALADRLGEDDSARVLLAIDEYYADLYEGDDRVATQVARQARGSPAARRSGDPPTRPVPPARRPLARLECGRRRMPGRRRAHARGAVVTAPTPPHRSRRRCPARGMADGGARGVARPGHDRRLACRSRQRSGGLRGARWRARWTRSPAGMSTARSTH